MKHTTNDSYPTITREKRIMLRVKRYIDGEISIDEFANLERFDEAIAEMEGEADTYKKSAREAEKLKQLHEEEKAKKAAEEKARKKKLNLSKEEYNKLPIYEKQRLYDEHPDEVKALIEESRLTPFEKYMKNR